MCDSEPDRSLFIWFVYSDGVQIHCGRANKDKDCVIETAAQPDYCRQVPPTADPAQYNLSQADVTS